MIRLKLTTILLLGILTEASACLCWFPIDKRSVKERFEKADVVFHAIAVGDSITRDTVAMVESLVSETSFDIKEVWKGGDLLTKRLSAKLYPCKDASYISGESYIIFGYVDKATGSLETNDCNSLRAHRVVNYEERARIASKVDNVKYDRVTEEMRSEFESVRQYISRLARRRT